MQNLIVFWHTFFHMYNITTEVVMLALIAVISTIIILSKPERTLMMKVFQAGLAFAAFIMILHICLVCETVRMKEDGSRVLFNILYVLYSICYVTELELILTYQTLLSFRRRQHLKQIYIMCIGFGLICFTILLLPLFRGRLVEFKNGVCTMTHQSDAYVLCSFLCAVLAGIVTIINRHSVSKIVYIGSYVFVPLELAGVATQLFFHTDFFICATYTLPFIIYYILFHAARYDDITGCQGKSAYRSLLKSFIKSRQDFIHLSVYAPALEARNLSKIGDIVSEVTINLSRLIEYTDKRVRVYSFGAYDYAVLCPVKNDFEADSIKQKFIEILTDTVTVGGKSYKVPLNILVSGRIAEIDSYDDYRYLLYSKKSEFISTDVDQIKVVTDEDARKFKRYLKIEKALLDMKYNSSSLNDDRVLVYIQPIYKIKNHSFTTGEALMRLQLDGEMFFPDEFIPIAEKNRCIHALTRIMLYKAAKICVEMKNRKIFDALTVNVSTVEMTEPNVPEEFMGIIRRAGADSANIRMEITESTSIHDYENVVFNITDLVEKGIHFYLDDFGTGYSNLDRVIGIPFKTIKFDKSLIYKAFEDKNTEELLHSLVKFFKNRGFSLVAEGIETEEQRDYVVASGFDFIQGYLYSKPLPSEKAFRLFENR